MLNLTTIVKVYSLDCSQHFESWPKKYPLCVHAEGQTTAAVLLLASFHNRPIHVCHVARKEEIEIIRLAKERVSAHIGNSH